MTRVLVTGGAGFIGRHLVRYLLRETDWSVTVLDRIGEGSDLNALVEGFRDVADARLAFYWHDLKAPLRLASGYDYVLHLAAGSHVDRSIKDPLGFVADNVVGTAHMLEWARTCEGLKKFLHFSTDEVFGACNGRGPFDEYESFHPTNPYSASKAAAEALCPAWANTFGVPIVVTRCTNVAGPGQSDEKFIPGTIGRIRRDSLVQVHAREGVPSSRKYIDVEDVCAAVLYVLNKGGIIAGRGTGYYNIAGDTDWSNLEVVAKLGELMGKSPRWELVEDPPNRPRPDMRYDLNNQRLKDLGWSQRVTLDETLKRILAHDA